MSGGAIGEVLRAGGGGGVRDALSMHPLGKKVWAEDGSHAYTLLVANAVTAGGGVAFDSNVELRSHLRLMGGSRSSLATVEALQRRLAQPHRAHSRGAILSLGCALPECQSGTPSLC